MVTLKGRSMPFSPPPTAISPLHPSFLTGKLLHRMPFTATTYGDSATPFGLLLLAVFNSILEVVLICAAGYLLSRRGILDKKTQKQLNRLNVSLFTPALLFSKVALYLTPAKLKELWVIPIYFLIVTTVSMTVGSVLGWLFGLRQSQKSFVMAAAMFMNSNALPIALMQSLVVAVPDLMWGPNDNKNAMLGRALTYLTMYSTLGMVVRYSYGVHLLARADTVAEIQVRAATATVDERTPLLIDNAATEVLRTRPSTSTMVDDFQDDGNVAFVSSPKDIGSPLRHDFPSSGAQSIRPPTRRRTTFYNSFPNSPNDSQTNLAQYSYSGDVSTASSDTEADADDDSRANLDTNHENGNGNGQHVHVLPTHIHQQQTRQHSKVTSTMRRVQRFWAALNNFMTVPLWAALVSLMVACIQPLQHALTSHLQPVNGAIDTAGKCAVPLTLVVLGAYFYTPPEEGGDAVGTGANGVAAGKGKKSGSSSWFKYVQSLFSLHSYERSVTPPQLTGKDDPKPGETKTVTLAVLARMFITPILVMPLMVLATRYDFHAVFEDPVFVVCNIILLSSPPALTLAQITQAVSGDAFERLISRTIFWSYCVWTPPITILYVVIGLFLAKL